MSGAKKTASTFTDDELKYVLLMVNDELGLFDENSYPQDDAIRLSLLSFERKAEAILGIERVPDDLDRVRNFLDEVMS